MPFRLPRFRTLIKITLTALFGTTLVIGITAALTAWESGRPRTLPQPSGRYEIGRRFFAWRDEARLDPLSPVRNAKRELAAFIWYPASKVSMGTRTLYAS